MANEIKTHVVVDDDPLGDLRLQLQGMKKDLDDVAKAEAALSEEQAVLNEATEQLEGHAAAGGQAIAGLATKVAALVAAYVSFRTVKNFISDSIQEAIKANDEWTTMQATLSVTGRNVEETSAKIKELAKSTEDLTRFQGGQVVQAAGLLSVYRNINEDMFPRTIMLAEDMARVFGRDLAGQTQMLARALQAPETANRLLRQSGVELTDQLQKQIKVMVDAGDIAGAQRIILDELEASYAGLADTLGEEVADRLIRVQNQFTAIKTELGTDLLPLLEELIPVAETAGIAFGHWLDSLDASRLSGFNGELSKFQELMLGISVLASNPGDTATMASHGMLGGIMGFLSDVEVGAESAVRNLPGIPKFIRDAIDDNIEQIIAQQDTFKNAADDAAARGGRELNALKDEAIAKQAEGEAARAQREEDRKRAQEGRELRAGIGKLMGDAPESDEELGKKFEKIFGESLKEEVAAEKERAKEIERAAKEHEREIDKEARRIEKELDDEREAEDKLKKEDERRETFQASFMGLTDLYRNLSAAAASETPEQRLEAAVIKVADEVARVPKTLEELDKRSTERHREHLKILEDGMGVA